MVCHPCKSGPVDDAALASGTPDASRLIEEVDADLTVAVAGLDVVAAARDPISLCALSFSTHACLDGDAIALVLTLELRRGEDATDPFGRAGAGVAGATFSGIVTGGLVAG